MVTQEEVLTGTDARMQKSVEALQRELSSIRTGRATPALIENLMIDYYGVPTPLNQLAGISVPEARVLLVQPWGKQKLKDVEKGILKSDLGIMPKHDWNVHGMKIPDRTYVRSRDPGKCGSSR